MVEVIIVSTGIALIIALMLAFRMQSNKLSVLRELNESHCQTIDEMVEAIEQRDLMCEVYASRLDNEYLENLSNEHNIEMLTNEAIELKSHLDYYKRLSNAHIDVILKHQETENDLKTRLKNEINSNVENMTQSFRTPHVIA